MLAEQKMRWLVDQDLPQLEAEDPDVLPVTRYGRDVITEALEQERWVVTRNQHLLDARTIPFHCPPIVIVGNGFCTQEGLRRNLVHLEFCLRRALVDGAQEGQRFFMELDRAVYRVRPEGGLQELEMWKSPSAKVVLAWGASA